ncbi:class I SAM-dependent methyltransferase, partial [Xanthomonas sp. Kuri4-1]
MTTDQIRFTDGTRYERYMGRWSQIAGAAFLDWLDPPAGQRWLDVGCGNGAFTETLFERCDPTSVAGVDPSEEQLEYARARPSVQAAQFRRGDAMALPYADAAFDVAVMPLVIFFVPDPGQGVAEMKRVVRPGGCVTAYAWDMPGGGFPYEPLLAELRGRGLALPRPPSPEASRTEVMQALWAAAGLQRIETRVIAVQRTFEDFDDFWETALGAPSVGPTLARMAADELASLAARV